MPVLLDDVEEEEPLDDCKVEEVDGTLCDELEAEVDVVGLEVVVVLLLPPRETAA